MNVSKAQHLQPQGIHQGIHGDKMCSGLTYDSAHMHMLKEGCVQWYLRNEHMLLASGSKSTAATHAHLCPATDVS